MQTVKIPIAQKKLKASVPSCRSTVPAESQYAPQLMAYKEAAVIRAIAHKYHLTTAPNLNVKVMQIIPEKL